MKKTKIFTSAILLVLALGLLTVGVLAANANKNIVGFGGKIQIQANDLNISVKGYLNTVDETPEFDSSISTEWLFNESPLLFEAEKYDNLNQVPTIKLIFEITKQSELPANAYFAKTKESGVITSADKIDSESLDVLNEDDSVKIADIVNVTLGSGSLTSTTVEAETITIEIEFSLAKFIENEQYSSESLTFNYTLRVEDQ